jgi:hypothetical protein
MSELNTNKYNWGEQLKVEVGDLTSRGGASSYGGSKAPSGPIPVGRHAAFLQEVKHGSFKTGSYGVTFTYVFESGEAKNRKIRETIVLSKADGTPVKFANSRLKRRLMSLGMAIEKINAFKGPRNEHDLGDFKLVLGAPVTLIISEDKDSRTGEIRTNPTTGIAYRVVKAAYAREVQE